MAFTVPLLLWFEENDEQYPDTSGLLQELKKHLTGYGTSTNVSRELGKAKQAAQDAKARYLDHLVLKEAWAMIKGQKFKVEGGTSEEERAFFLQELDSWHKRISAAQCRVLNVPGLKISKQPLLNKDFVDTAVVPLVDDHLTQRCQTLVKCLEIPCAVEDLDSAVRSRSSDVESLEQQLESLTFRHARHLFRFEELLKEFASIKEQWPASISVSAEWHCCKSQALEVQCYKDKVSKTRVELLMDIYSKEKVDALKLIRVPGWLSKATLCCLPPCKKCNRHKNV